DQQDRRAALAQLVDRVEELVDDDGRETHRDLVHHQHARLAHKPSAECQHLLLAARQRARGLRQALAEPGERADDVVELRTTASLRAASTGTNRYLDVVAHA